MADTCTSAAMWAATQATRKILAQAKNRRTVLGQMSPTGVAYHAAIAAIDAYRDAWRRAQLNGLPTGTFEFPPLDALEAGTEGKSDD